MPGNSTAPIIIVGMHRSGTTLVSALLDEMGLHIGDHKSTQHEAYAFRNVNDRLLRGVGAHWAKPEPFLAKLGDPVFIENASQDARALLDEFGPDFGVTPDGGRWGWKDPRTTLTLPAWRVIYPDARVIHVVRNGLDVALSVYRREIKIIRRRLFTLKTGGRRGLMTPPTLARGFKLWELYTRAALAEENHWGSWLTIKYETVLAQPEQSLGQINDFAGMGWSADRLGALAAEKIHKGHAPSSLERQRFRWLVRLGLVDVSLMHELGYPIA